MPSFEQLNLPGLSQILAVSAGGLVGSLARFLTGHYLAQAFGTTFPWGTLVVNFLGTALLTFVITVAFNKPGSINPDLRFFLTTGFAGGFTTFSALAFETFSLYQKGEVLLASLNIGGNLVLGLLAVVIGLVLARLI